MQEITASEKGYVIITDYVKANTGVDVADQIQQVIDSNPRRTIFFPDGEYLISKPLCTAGHPDTAVSLDLSNFAIIKATPDWSSDECMIRLGGKDRYFRINKCGTNNFLSGGIIDGSGVAKGLSIDSGREYSIRNVSLKFVTHGIHVKWNDEYGSNDSDIFNVNIVGMGVKGSVGLLIEGSDNTFANMRIANFEVGVRCSGGGNFLRNIHPLYIYKDDNDFSHAGEIEYLDSVGFDDRSNGTWYDICYSDNFATGFRMADKSKSIYNSCFAYWYTTRGDVEIGFESTGRFNSVIKSSRIDLRNVSEAAYLKVAEAGGSGSIDCPIFRTEACTNDHHIPYLTSKITNGN